MADKSQAIRVEGLAEFQRALRDISKEMASELRVANLLAAQVIERSATGKAHGLGSVAAKTAPSIKAAAEQRRAKVSLGGGAYPFAMGAEFGGKGRPTTQQFKPHRGTQGYFLYPAIRGSRGQFMDVMERAIDQLMRKAFPS